MLDKENFNSIKIKGQLYPLKSSNNDDGSAPVANSPIEQVCTIPYDITNKRITISWYVCV